MYGSHQSIEKQLMQVYARVVDTEQKIGVIPNILKIESSVQVAPYNTLLFSPTHVDRSVGTDTSTEIISSKEPKDILYELLDKIKYPDFIGVGVGPANSADDWNFEALHKEKLYQL